MWRYHYPAIAFYMHVVVCTIKETLAGFVDWLETKLLKIHGYFWLPKCLDLLLLHFIDNSQWICMNQQVLHYVIICVITIIWIKQLITTFSPRKLELCGNKKTKFEICKKTHMLKEKHLFIESYLLILNLMPATFKKKSGQEHVYCHCVASPHSVFGNRGIKLL